MENASLVGLSRQVALRRELDVISNNVANMNTAGFKAEEMVFNEFVSPVARDNTFQRRDRPLSFVADVATATNFAGGEVQTTGGETDVAIIGRGFFTVETPEGPRYTRAGALRKTGTGQLVSSHGYPVLTTAGPITFAPGERDIVIGSDGTISTSEGIRGRLRIAEFDNYAAMRKTESGVFDADVAPREAPVATRIVQGAIEKSNVNAVAEMSRLIEVSRAYTSISAILDKQDEIRRSAIERLAEIPS